MTAPSAHPTECRRCQSPVTVLDIFPGGLCLECYRPIGDRLARTMTADDLTAMWGGPRRHTRR